MSASFGRTIRTGVCIGGGHEIAYISTSRAVMTAFGCAVITNTTSISVTLSAGLGTGVNGPDAMSIGTFCVWIGAAA